MRESVCVCTRVHVYMHAHAQVQVPTEVRGVPGVRVISDCEQSHVLRPELGWDFCKSSVCTLSHRVISPAL